MARIVQAAQRNNRPLYIDHLEGDLGGTDAIHLQANVPTPVVPQSMATSRRESGIAANCGICGLGEPRWADMRYSPQVKQKLHRRRLGYII